MNPPRVAITVCCVLLAVGCESSSDRAALEGIVTLDGEPLPDGQIVFLPQADATGPSAGSTIENGNYSVPADMGLFAGNFRVEITAERKTGRKIVGFLGEEVDQVENYLPARYNDQSELVAQVEAGRKNTFDFELESE